MPQLVGVTWRLDHIIRSKMIASSFTDKRYSRNVSPRYRSKHVDHVSRPLFFVRLQIISVRFPNLFSFFSLSQTTAICSFLFLYSASNLQLPYAARKYPILCGMWEGWGRRGEENLWT